MLLANLRKLLDAQAVELGASWANPYVVAVQVLAPVGLLGLVLVQNLQESSWELGHDGVESFTHQSVTKATICIHI